MNAATNRFLEAADHAAEYLRSLGARRVWLFGSLAQGCAPDSRSDIDLTVEGLPEDRYFEAVGVLLGQMPCSVDLVEMERAPAALRENILRFRRELPRAH